MIEFAKYYKMVYKYLGKDIAHANIFSNDTVLQTGFCAFSDSYWVDFDQNHKFEGKIIWYSKLASKTVQSHVYIKSFGQFLFSSKQFSRVSLRGRPKHDMYHKAVFIVSSSVIWGFIVIY